MGLSSEYVTNMQLYTVQEYKKGNTDIFLYIYINKYKKRECAYY